MKFLLVGAGHLGLLVGAQARALGYEVFVLNRRPERTKELADQGLCPLDEISLRSRAWRFSAGALIVPPQPLLDFARLCRLMSEQVQGPWVQSSSTGVYELTNGEEVNDSTGRLGNDDRARSLLDLEAEATQNGACVLRLAGLYDQTSGPHHVYLRQNESPLRPDGYINLLHYQDAARFLVKSLAAIPRGEVRLLSDGAPITRKELASLALVWWKNLQKQKIGEAPCRFLGSTGPLGNRYAPNFALWNERPKIPSFSFFSQALDLA